MQWSNAIARGLRAVALTAVLGSSLALALPVAPVAAQEAAPTATPAAPAPAAIYLGDGQETAHIPPPSGPTTPEGAGGLAAQSDIDVQYTGFSAPAQAAFQYAVSLLERVVLSNVTIEVRASFTPLGGNQLGFAGPTLIFTTSDFPWHEHPGHGIPIALLNARLSTDYCTPGALHCDIGSGPIDHDINATFSSTATWYFGTDGNPGPGQVDFVSVVLHELVHGLGFVAHNHTITTGGDAGPTATRTLPPSLYTRPIETGAGVALNSIPSGSTTLYGALTGNNLFYDGPQAVAANGGVRPRIYAPASFQPGTSLNHLDEATYPATNVNTLMTPIIATGQSVHDPGPIGRGILADTGWAVVPYLTTAVPGDFDGNGLADTAVFRPSTGQWFAAGAPTVQWGNSSDIRVPGQWDADKAADVAVYRPSQGRWYIEGTPGFVQWGKSTDIPVPGDYNGDGIYDPAVFRPSEGRWYIQGAGAAVQFGRSTDIPVPGQWDGDIETDIAMFRPSEGRWYIHGGGSIQWGKAGDIPVPGDYDGNGVTDAGVYRSSEGRWYLDNDGAPVQFGKPTDIPVPAQWDRDPATDVAVFRPSTNQWFIQTSGGTDTRQWGQAGDRQVVHIPGAAAR